MKRLHVYFILLILADNAVVFPFKDWQEKSFNAPP